jgi:hypothetical protein
MAESAAKANSVISFLPTVVYHLLMLLYNLPMDTLMLGSGTDIYLLCSLHNL